MRWRSKLGKPLEEPSIWGLQHRCEFEGFVPGSEAEKSLSRFFDRSILDYQDLITSEDPVVKETLKKLLKEKKW